MADCDGVVSSGRSKECKPNDSVDGKAKEYVLG